MKLKNHSRSVLSFTLDVQHCTKIVEQAKSGHPNCICLAVTSYRCNLVNESLGILLGSTDIGVRNGNSQDSQDVSLSF